jgi:XTP/dITP diphosphohydrolase
MLAVADDSGIEVDALDGRPGVRSARYAGPGATDDQNNAKLVAEARAAGLFDLPEKARARFRCVLSVATPAGRLVCHGEGACEGALVRFSRGSGGFGYDPHFLLPELGCTFAELAAEQKNQVSHRARALADLVRHLEPELARLAQDGP